MIPDTASVLTYASEHRLPIKQATEKLLEHSELAELRRFVVDKLSKAAAKKARDLLQDFVLSEPTVVQLELFEMHHVLPPLVRIDTDGDGELFIHWQNATLLEHAESIRWKRQHHTMQAGIAERIERRIHAFEGPDDLPVGMLMFDGIVCAICADPWEIDDPRGPFELAHDEPVAGRSDNPTVRWAHRKCNQAEGTK
jgi:hypothetical protein